MKKLLFMLMAIVGSINIALEARTVRYVGTYIHPVKLATGGEKLASMGGRFGVPDLVATQPIIAGKDTVDGRLATKIEFDILATKNKRDAAKARQTTGEKGPGFDIAQVGMEGEYPIFTMTLDKRRFLPGMNLTKFGPKHKNEVSETDEAATFVLDYKIEELQ